MRLQVSFTVVASHANLQLGARRSRLGHGPRIPDAGMQPLTLDLIADRLDAAVADGAMERGVADELFEASPYHHQLEGNRENRIWLAAEPYPPDDSGVTGLIGSWGGESVSFNHREGRLARRLRGSATPAQPRPPCRSRRPPGRPAPRRTCSTPTP